MTKFQHILIALPTVARAMKSGTAISIAKTAMALQAQGIAVDLHNIDSAEIVTARDMFANMLLYSDSWDAMLFVDSDMGFDPRLVLRLLGQGADVAAAACPRRTLDLVQLVNAAASHGDLDRARSQASQFTIAHDWDDRSAPPRELRDGFCSAATCGMAIALIGKAALQTMVAQKVVEPRLDLSTSSGEPCYSFFGILEPDGGRLGEDYSFCYRWTKLLGREMRVCLDETVSHYGDFEFYGRYTDVL
ncbi:hypothetical protein [Sphingomonas sp.]|jgi:hypothetical protein|uniref:hypothetical protein n=1 Tax=Sphingomonas sp. TaxID=28214 RepID=UPI002D806B03|nr:hypothetical protein [Sphingomonas sp.]HEU0044540.1 hypothetical protein [Sphingomonas sp.]